MDALKRLFALSKTSWSPAGLAVLVLGALLALLARPLSRGQARRETLLRLAGLFLAMVGALVTMRVF